jgi:hypothetical protein
VAVRIDERDEVSALRLREHADEVPAFLPLDLVLRQEGDGPPVGRGLPHGLATGETYGAVLLRDDLSDELGEAPHLRRVRFDVEGDVELLQAAGRQDPLPDELCEGLLGLIVVDDRKVCPPMKTVSG